MAKPKATTLETRVADPCGVRFPDPVLPAHRPEPVIAKPVVKPEQAVFDGRSIAKTLALNSAQAREYRLKDLAKRNNDVKWLVEEYEKLKTK